MRQLKAKYEMKGSRACLEGVEPRRLLSDSGIFLDRSFGEDRPAGLDDQLVVADVEEAGPTLRQRLHDRSTLITFEHEWKVIVDFGLLFFGLANAGVQLSAVGTVTWLVVLSLLVGKTAGIFGLGMLARTFGFPLPTGMSVWALFLVSMTAGIGLTVALFMSGAAFADPQIEAAAKMGALASVVVVPMVLLLKRLRDPVGTT